MEACGDNPVKGYTAAYVPEASLPLDDQYDTMLISGNDSLVIDSNFSMDCTLYLGERPLAWIGMAWLGCLPDCPSVCLSACLECSGIYLALNLA